MLLVTLRYHVCLCSVEIFSAVHTVMLIIYQGLPS